MLFVSIPTSILTSMLRYAALILIWSGDRPTSPDHEKNPPTTKLDYKFMSDLIDLSFPECINVFLSIPTSILTSMLRCTALILIWRGNPPTSPDQRKKTSEH